MMKYYEDNIIKELAIAFVSEEGLVKAEEALMVPKSLLEEWIKPYGMSKEILYPKIPFVDDSLDIKKTVQHFGCRLTRYSEEFNITREKYGEITDASRKNSFKHELRFYRGLDSIQARQRFWMYDGYDMYCNMMDDNRQLYTDYKKQCEILKSGGRLKGRYIMKPPFLRSLYQKEPQSELSETPAYYIYQYIMNRMAPYHTDRWCENKQKQVLENFDYNMAYCERLSAEKFNREIDEFLHNHSDFVEVKNLNDFKCTGIYVLILDQYKQAYIGIAWGKEGIKHRVQQHWSTRKTFDRMIWGTVKDSVISVDSYFPLDITRILACPRLDLNNYSLPQEEWRLIEESFSPEFLCNRSAGGCESLLESAFMSRHREENK